MCRHGRCSFRVLLGNDGALPYGAPRHSINLSGCNRLTDAGITALKALRRLSYLELAVRPSPYTRSVEWTLLSTFTAVTEPHAPRGGSNDGRMTSSVPEQPLGLRLTECCDAPPGLSQHHRGGCARAGVAVRAHVAGPRWLHPGKPKLMAS
jgi:hypothetical protein